MPAALGSGPLADERLARADDVGDRSDEVHGQVDGVAEQIGAHAMAGLIDEEPPRQHAERVVPVAGEEPPAVVRDAPEPAAVDELLGVLHERCPAVVVPDAGDDVAGGALRGDGLCRRATDRLLAEHRLAGGRGGTDHLDVQHVRGGDDDEIDVGVLDDLAPVVGRLGEAEAFDRLGAPGRDGIGADDEHRVGDAIGEQRRDAAVGPAVGLAHPAEPDNADAQAPPCHRRGRHVRLVGPVIGQRGSVGMPTHDSRTQWCVGSSQNAIDRSSPGPARTFR